MRAERRIVTVLFVDIAGSTAITETLDPEDVRDLVGGALAIVISHVDGSAGRSKTLQATESWRVRCARRSRGRR